MFEFGNDTVIRRISNLIKEGGKVADEEYVIKEINRFRVSKRRKDMVDGEKYYEGKHDILHRKRTIIGKDGKLEEVENLPNNRIVDNQYQKMVDQKNNYLLGQPFSIQSNNDVYAKLLKQVFNKKFHRLLKNIGEDSLNEGIAWMFVYYDEHEYNLAEVNKNKYLRVAAIYGANASGKTNALLAYNYMKKRILVSDDINKNNKIDEENVFSFMINNNPISMEVEILAKNNKIYKYGFEVLKDKVVSEWLYIRKAKGFSEIFERNNDNKVILKEAKKETQFTIDEDTLFLNLYTKLHSDNVDFSNVYEWFVESLYLDLGNPIFERMITNRISIKLIESKEYRTELIKFIKNIDPGIEDIRTSIDKIEDLRNVKSPIEIEVIHKTKSNKDNK